MVAQVDGKFVKARPFKLYTRLVSYFLFEGRPLTTRGRWINPFIFGLFKVLSVLPKLAKVDRPIFILGVGRSGTTILGKILALHRHVGYLNEPKALWQAALGDDDVIGSYSDHDGRFRMSGADVTAKKTRIAHKLYAGYQRVAFARRVVDKYPEMIYRRGLVDGIFSDNRMLFLVRSGIDTCQSIEHWSERLSTSTEDESQDWWGRDNRKWRLLLSQVVDLDPALAALRPHIDGLSRHVDMAALEWIATMREGLAALDTDDQALLLVRYEDLVADPAQSLSEMFDYCALEHDPVVIEYAKSELSPPREKPPLELDPVLRPLFNDTMQRLGYSDVV
jgi:hypothetical protein